jgi:mRNA-degrading endonuclease toxin of MazEF toxin-antitoxin module
MLEPSKSNGLKKASYVMTEKLLTVHKSRLGIRIGCLTGQEMQQVSEQMAVVLGIKQNEIPAGQRG